MNLAHRQWMEFRHGNARAGKLPPAAVETLEMAFICGMLAYVMMLREVSTDDHDAAIAHFNQCEADVLAEATRLGLATVHVVAPTDGRPQ